MGAKTLKELLDTLILAEGGYSDNKKDSGGKTMYGITEAVARANGYTGGMSAMPRSIAEKIYTARYWVGPKFDKVAELAPSVAAEMFDCGVNMGPATAAKYLQRILNAYNREQKLYEDILVDGQLGPRSIATLQSCLRSRGYVAEGTILKGIVCLRGARYLELAETRESQEEFVFGWIANRITLSH